MRILITKSFTGDPRGKKTAFVSGETVDVTKAYIDEANLIGKGFVAIPDEPEPDNPDD